jgi:hypothetical protein
MSLAYFLASGEFSRFMGMLDVGTEGTWLYKGSHGKVWTDEPCWLWTGNVDSAGYPRWSYGGKTVRAHRLAWEKFNGEEIPTDEVGMSFQIDHMCRHTSCVNPAHLEAVPWLENQARTAGLTPLNTRCSNGHLMTPDNTHLRADGRRICRQCNAEAARKRRRERRT